MKGDFSRSTFRPHKHYRNVRLQQGRVQLDADWNEQADIQAHRDQLATRDMVGPTGAPLHEAGFALSVRNNRLWIGAGRYYVDGLLCENEGDLDFEAQPDLPGARLPAPPGTYLAYLDAWKRHITAVEDPSLREVALGGPDTTTREKMVWQVKLQQVLDNSEIRTFSSPDWAPRNTRSSGRIRARANPNIDPDGSASPGGGYRRLENQLYRVEIHEGGEPVGTPPSEALTAIQDVAGAEVQVVNDDRRWQAGEMVELFGAADSGAPGTLARIVAVDERPQSGRSASLRAVDFRDPIRPRAVGDDATILASEDGGANWTQQQPPQDVGANLNGVYFSGSNGFAVGDDATILATTDGGAHWVQQEPPDGVTASLRAISFSNINRPRAVGDDATILASEDGGANWTQQQPPQDVGANLNGVYFSGSNGFAVGDDATILATTDGGSSWTQQQPPQGVGANLNGVYFSDSGAWAVGDDATILASEDGGASWAEQSPPQGVGANFRAVHFAHSLVDRNAPPRGWAVGDGAVILVSEDGGSSWTEQQPPQDVGANLNGVYFSGSNGFAVGDDATILATTDAGTTWTQQTTQVLSLDKDVSEIDPRPALLRRVATFKFSRDNGTVLTRLEEINGDILTVSDPGRDATLGFVDGVWVELGDEERVLRGEPGILVQLASVDGNDLTVDRWPDDTPLMRTDFGTLPTVRRWDSEHAIPVTIGSWLDLEDGVEVQFAIDTQDKAVEDEVAEEFHTGDYWTIPARSLTGDVEWPRNDPGSRTPGQPVFEPRHGIEHHYCPLGLLELKDRTWSPTSDYRKHFPPITELMGSGIRVVGVFMDSTGQALGPELAVAVLAKGIRVACENKLDPRLADGRRLCSVTLDMPFPFNDQDRELMWGGDAVSPQQDVIGVNPLTLSAEETISDVTDVVWRPSPRTQDWLQNKLPGIMRRRFQQPDGLLAHLTLRGSTFETWFWLKFEQVTETQIGFIPNLEPADGRGYPFATEQVRARLSEALSLAINRTSLSEVLPPGYSVDETLEFDPDQARSDIDRLRDRDSSFDPFWLVLIQRRLFEDEERLYSLRKMLFDMLKNVGIEPFDGRAVGEVGDTDNEKGVEEVLSYLKAFEFAPLVIIGDETFASDLSFRLQQHFDDDLLIYF